MEQYMWLLVVREQACQLLPLSKQNGAFSKTMIMDLLSSQHLTTRTFCSSTRRAGMGRFTTLSEFPEIIGTSWPALLIVAQAPHWPHDLDIQKQKQIFVTMKRDLSMYII